MDPGSEISVGARRVFFSSFVSTSSTRFALGSQGQFCEQQSFSFWELRSPPLFKSSDFLTLFRGGRQLFLSNFGPFMRQTWLLLVCWTECQQDCRPSTAGRQISVASDPFCRVSQPSVLTYSLKLDEVSIGTWLTGSSAIISVRSSVLPTSAEAHTFCEHFPADFPQFFRDRLEFVI